MTTAIVSPPRVIAVLATQSGATRTEQFMGRDFLVVPATLVRSQVLENNLGKTFLPPDEITDAWADLWNSVPVVVQDHPKMRGVAVSARDPQILSDFGAGWIFKARAHDADAGARELKAEVWLDLARVGEVPELEGIVDQLQNSTDPVELSTGFPTEVLEATGEFQGKAYNYVLRPLGADHLAIFLEKTGACSVRDGCGLGVNTTTEGEIAMAPTARNLSLVDRMLALFNASTDDLLVKRALMVKRLRAHGMTSCEIASAVNTTKEEVLAWEAGEKEMSDDAYNALVRVAAQRLPALNASAPLSDDEKRDQLWRGVRGAFGAADREVWLEAVFSDQSQLVYSIMDLAGPRESGPQMFRVGYTLEKDGSVTFADDATPVLRRITFEPVRAKRGANTQQTGDVNMEGTDKGQAPVTPAAAPAVENAAAEFAAKLDKLTDLVAANAESMKALGETIKAQGETIAKQAERIEALNTAAQPAIAEQQRTRETIIATLTKDESGPFTKEELEAKPLAELQKLAALTGVDVPAHFTGRGAPREQSANSKPAFMPVEPYFKKAEQPAS